MTTFKDFATQGKYVRLADVGDSIILIVKVDPFTLEPKPGNFKDQKTKEPKLVIEYVFTDPETEQEKIFTNGSQAFAQQMAKTKVGDTVKIIKIERNGKPAYTVRKVSEGDGVSLDEIKLEDEGSEPIDPKKIPF
ncbi:MAG: hypothetical protein EHM34_06135 [Nitrosopumilales archaeon]|nr:MAG: hypothetical protein EHM34_06135 [Nitrosopumilales archaeon]